ncbi:MAG: Stk1 family PASTA domain-containing Ser/Thr kinase [Eubacterium sp.]|nr:Stk1 family PASTA domain-containing Ser/Thr kinase [Eubacterium sp.]
MLKEGVILSERYEIMSRIGSGGMADVYKAQDRKLNRLVAVKVMKAEFREDTSFVSKFTKEAQAAAKLSHPNVVNVYDVGEDRGLYFIVMELIEGITLKNYIAKKGKLSVKEATSIAIQASLGLEAAHNRGIIHRDVKPQNIIISTDGKVKLSDFGIAKSMNSNTITANVMGSVHYSSPEQVRGGYSDARGDIYSLGITMYEMVTGRVPFDGDTTVSIAIKHLQEEIVPPSIYTPDLPYSLEQIILKCTQKNPDRRYQNVGSMIDDLKRSLIDPQGNFVVIEPLSAHASTVQLSDDETEAIRHQQGEKRPYEADDRRSRREEEDRRRKRDEDYDTDEYDDDDDDDDEDEGGASALEKILTILGFAVGAIIIIVLILFIGRMAGIFSFGNKSASTSASSSTSVVSENPTDVDVPDLTGMTLEEATAAANKSGLGVHEKAQEASDQYAQGVVIRIDGVEVGSKVPVNTTLEVIVSSGKADVQIPGGLTGAAQADAENALTAAGLVAGVQLEYDDNVAIGTVISVNPGEGSMVAAGSTVTLVVSKGPNTAENNVVIPELRGMAQADAEATLQSMAVNYTIVGGSANDVGVGEVIGTDPASGTQIDKTTTSVTVTVNQGGSGRYVCYSPLSKPSGYNGGTVKLELVQGDKVTTFYEGSDPWGDGNYTDPIVSDSGDVGTINVYEDGVLIARYPNVTFTEE